MTIETIFGSQLILSVLVFAFLAKWYLVPWLEEKPVHAALGILVIPHAIRHVGLVFLVPGVVSPELASSFSGPAAYGDLAAGLLAILTLVALRGSWRFALPLAFVFNVVGTVDLVNALRHAEVIPHLGAAWFIPTFLVPVLLVTHALVFARLYRHVRERAFHEAGAGAALCATPQR